MVEIIHRPSPNFDLRPSGTDPDLIIIHYTDMTSCEEALARLCDPEAKVSAHFLISKTGVLYQLVDPNYRAWHAGKSTWEGKLDINNTSIGIELDNFGHSFGPESFPEDQITVLLHLLKELTQTYQIPSHRVLGHSDIAPLRKQDPGDLFPWHVLAKAGFGLWPEEGQFLPEQSWDTSRIQNAFLRLGYACPQTGSWDEETQAVCFAFQRHFTPEELTGQATNLTRRTLEKLLKV